MTRASRPTSGYDVHPAVAHEAAILENLPAKTGRSLAEWIQVIRAEGPATEPELREWLKTEKGVGTVTAWVIAQHACGSAEPYDPEALVEAVRAKLTCLGELARLEARRDAAVAAWARQSGLPDDTSFDQVLRRLDPATGQRLGLYQLGVEAHLDHCRALRPANRALAQAAVARHADWRHFLLRQAAGGGSWPAEPA